MTSALENSLHWRLQMSGLPIPETEYRFHPTRRWRFDFAWPQYKLAVEIEGAIWAQGRHTRGTGFTSDCQKYNQATLDGWRVLRFTAEMIDSGEALKMITEALEVIP